MKINIINRHRNLIQSINQIYFNKILIPKAVYIEPTNICNANCIFCAYQYYDAKKAVMPFGMYEDILKECKKIGITKINLSPFAGEILVDKEIIKKINILKRYDFDVVEAYTNLLLLNRFDVDDFLNSGIKDLYISTAPLDKRLYDMIYRVDKYDVLLGNLEMLLKRFNSIEQKTIKRISIQFRGGMRLADCICLPDYKKYIEVLINNDIKVSAMTCFDSWMGVIKKEDLIEGMTLKKENGNKVFPCSRLSSLQILSNGDMRICGCRYNNESDIDIFYVGNIRNMSILDAYNSDVVKNIKKSYFFSNSPVECRKCSWYS